MDSGDKTTIVIAICVLLALLALFGTIAYGSYKSNEQTIECIKTGTSALECKSALFQ